MVYTSFTSKRSVPDSGSLSARECSRGAALLNRPRVIRALQSADQEVLDAMEVMVDDVAKSGGVPAVVAATVVKDR